MIIKKITIQNIRSYKYVEVVFPEGSTLLAGDIGSGKTSILLAIEFALFGLQPGQKGNSLLRNNNDEASVKLEFEIGEDKVIIERTLKRGGKSVTQTDVAISVNNERFEGSVTEVKNKILNVLNYPPEFAKKTNDLYKFTVYTPQEEMKQIILESNDTRLNTLRHVFGIDKYKRIEENIEILTSKVRQEIRIKEMQIGDIEQKKQEIIDKKKTIEEENKKIVDVEKLLENVRKIKKEKQAEIDELTKKINEKKKLENEKEKAELNISNKKEILANNEREIKNLDEEIKAYGNISFREGEIEILKSRINIQERVLKELNENYMSLSSSVQAEEYKVKDLTSLRDKIASLDKCTTCLQVVNEEHKRNIAIKANDEINNIQKSLFESKKKKDSISLEIDKTKKQIEAYKDSLSQIQILKVKLESLKDKQLRKENIEKQKTVILSDIDMMRKHIEKLDETLRSFSDYDLLFESKNKDFREIISKENQFMISRAEINKEIQLLNRQISLLEEEIKKIEGLRKKLDYMKELEFWFSNKFIELVLYTEKNVMLKLREEFSKLFSEWFSIIVPESISVKLDESFSPLIQQRDYEIEYSYLSGGERTAVALAYRLALNQVINSLLSRINTRDLVILDEPTDGFSESQLDKIRDVLSQLKVKQLIIVSHEQKIESFVDNIIKFKKVDGISEIDSG